MKYFIYISLIVVLNGCATSYPFNMSEEQYLTLSKKQKLQSWEKQAVLNNKLKIQKMKKQMQLSKQQHELQVQQNSKIHSLENRNKIVVNISRGDFKYMKHGYYISPFELNKYEVKKLNNKLIKLE